MIIDHKNAIEWNASLQGYVAQKHPRHDIFQVTPWKLTADNPLGRFISFHWQWHDPDHLRETYMPELETPALAVAKTANADFLASLRSKSEPSVAPICIAKAHP